jgi:hypothetical protein
VRARRGVGTLRAVVLGAVLLRALALAADLRTSDDAWRLVWEGEVVLAGRSPYAFAPDDPALADLVLANPGLHARVNHRDVPASYPPLVQAAGAAAAAVTRVLAPGSPEFGVNLLRAEFAVLDLLLLVPLVALLRRRGLPDALALAWAWCPLAVFELGGSAHLEGLALPLLVAALAVGERPGSCGRDAAASALFAGAVLSKLLPIALLPWFLRQGRPWLRAALVLGLCVLAWLPFLLLAGGERGVLLGLSEYALRWEGGSLVHRFVEGALALRWERDLSWTDPRRVARALLVLTWIAWAWRTWRRERDPARAALDLFGAWLVLTPTLHPWYVLWAVPWLALRASPAFVWLALAAPLLFAPVPGWQQRGVWIEPAWVWPALALPFALLLARSRAAAHPAPPA